MCSDWKLWQELQRPYFQIRPCCESTHGKNEKLAVFPWGGSSKVDGDPS